MLQYGIIISSKKLQKTLLNQKEQIVEEIHKPARINFCRRKVKTYGIDDLWQADLVEMGNFSKENNSYNYMITIIDTFSKYAWILPVKRKTANDIVESLEKLLVRRCPKHLQTDQEK